MLALLAAAALLMADPQEFEVEVRGRVVDVEGAPIADQLVQLHWTQAPQVRRTDGEGRFSITGRGAPVNAEGYVTVAAIGLPTVHAFVRRSLLRVKGEHDVGDLVLGPPGTLVVRVFDVSGALQRGVALHCLLEHQRAQSASQIPTTAVDPKTGEARFPGLAPGRYEIRGVAELGQRKFCTIVSDVVEVTSDTETLVELHFDRLLGEVTRFEFAGDHQPADLTEQHIAVRDPDSGGRVAFELLPAEPGGLASRPIGLRLPPGLLLLDIDHPDVRLARPLAVQAGRTVRLEFVRAARSCSTSTRRPRGWSRSPSSAPVRGKRPRRCWPIRFP